MKQQEGFEPEQPPSAELKYLRKEKRIALNEIQQSLAEKLKANPKLEDRLVALQVYHEELQSLISDMDNGSSADHKRFMPPEDWKPPQSAEPEEREPAPVDNSKSKSRTIIELPLEEDEPGQPEELETATRVPAPDEQVVKSNDKVVEGSRPVIPRAQSIEAIRQRRAERGEDYLEVQYGQAVQAIDEKIKRRRIADPEQEARLREDALNYLNNEFARKREEAIKKKLDTGVAPVGDVPPPPSRSKPETKPKPIARERTQRRSPRVERDRDIHEAARNLPDIAHYINGWVPKTQEPDMDTEKDELFKFEIIEEGEAPPVRARKISRFSELLPDEAEADAARLVKAVIPGEGYFEPSPSFALPPEPIEPPRQKWWKRFIPEKKSQVSKMPESVARPSDSEEVDPNAVYPAGEATVEGLNYFVDGVAEGLETIRDLSNNVMSPANVETLKGLSARAKQTANNIFKEIETNPRIQTFGIWFRMKTCDKLTHGCTNLARYLSTIEGKGKEAAKTTAEILDVVARESGIMLVDAATEIIEVYDRTLPMLEDELRDCEIRVSKVKLMLVAVDIRYSQEARSIKESTEADELQNRMEDEQDLIMKEAAPLRKEFTWVSGKLRPCQKAREEAEEIIENSKYESTPRPATLTTDEPPIDFSVEVKRKIGKDEKPDKDGYYSLKTYIRDWNAAARSVALEEISTKELQDAFTLTGLDANSRMTDDQAYKFITTLLGLRKKPLPPEYVLGIKNNADGLSQRRKGNA